MATRFQYREARTPRSRGKKLDHIRIKESEDGGHTVEHYYAEDGMEFHKPKEYSFAKDEVGDLMEHLRRHAGVNEQVQITEDGSGE
jgi:hypothetical protein